MAKVIEFYVPKNFRKPMRTRLSRNSEKSSSFARRRRDQLSCYSLLRIERTYDVHSHTKRIYESGRFRKTVTRHLPELSQLGTVPSPAKSGTNRPRQRRSEQLAMFYITAGTCRFTLAEILIMAAMHLETIRLIPEDRVRTKTAVARRG